LSFQAPSICARNFAFVQQKKIDGILRLIMQPRNDTFTVTPSFSEGSPVKKEGIPHFVRNDRKKVE